MSLSTNLVSLSTANERWEETQKNNQKALSRVNLGFVGCVAGVPSSNIAGASIATYTNIFCDLPVITTLFYAASIVIPILGFLPLGGHLWECRDNIKSRIWTWENVHAFKKELQSTNIDTLDLKIKKLAMEAGVISEKNYIVWCTLVKEKQNLEKTKTSTLDYSKQPTQLQNDVEQKRVLYQYKFNELSTNWDTLKSDLLNDFPVQPSESVV
jgi:hypothetical protein